MYKIFYLYWSHRQNKVVQSKQRLYTTLQWVCFNTSPCLILPTLCTHGDSKSILTKGISDSQQEVSHLLHHNPHTIIQSVGSVER